MSIILSIYCENDENYEMIFSKFLRRFDIIENMFN